MVDRACGAQFAQGGSQRIQFFNGGEGVAIRVFLQLFQCRCEGIHLVIVDSRFLLRLRLLRLRDRRQTLEFPSRYRGFRRHRRGLGSILGRVRWRRQEDWGSEHGRGCGSEWLGLLEVTSFPRRGIRARWDRYRGRGAGQIEGVVGRRGRTWGRLLCKSLLGSWWWR